LYVFLLYPGIEGLGNSQVILGIDTEIVRRLERTVGKVGKTLRILEKIVQRVEKMAHREDIGPILK
jgi:hypothetical protein